MPIALSCPNMLHMCTWFNIIDESNPIHTCSHAAMQSYAHDPPPCRPLNAWRKEKALIIWFILIRWSCFVLLPMPCCHLSSMLTYCTCSPPPLHIWFFFIWHMFVFGMWTLFLWKATWTCVHLSRGRCAWSGHFQHSNICRGWKSKKAYMNILANPNEDHESWYCYFWNESGSLMNYGSGAHRFSWMVSFIFTHSIPKYVFIC